MSPSEYADNTPCRNCGKPRRKHHRHGLNCPWAGKPWHFRLDATFSPLKRKVPHEKARA